MTEYCKQQIKDTKNSTWQKEIFRSCKLKAEVDGYCRLHNPENVAMEIERRALAEMVEDLRLSERREEARVGAFLRLRNKQEFDAVLTEILNAEEITRQMRHR